MEVYLINQESKKRSRKRRKFTFMVRFGLKNKLIIVVAYIRVALQIRKLRLLKPVVGAGPL